MDSLMYLRACQQRCEQQLQAILPLSSNKLHQAMAYAVLNGGKRLRPALVYATGCALRLPQGLLDPIAGAIELIHCYSLVHDDLPAMDNDALRRGKPSCHRAFSEAIAILAGDALQTLAFNWLAQPNACLEPSQQLKMITTLSHAIGASGMACGQALDIEASGDIDLAQLKQIHYHKTGQLIKACIELVIIAARDQDDKYNEPLRQFANGIGLAFQIRDDILDIEGDSAKLGKLSGRDARLNKASYPAIIGMTKTKKSLQKLYNQAIDALTTIGLEHSHLARLASYVAFREQ